MPEKCRIGSPRVTHRLRQSGFSVGRNRVANRMRSMGLRAKAARNYKATTNSNHTLSVAPNLLLQDFYATAPNQKWVSDITYIWTDEGWLYLAVALDLFARRRRLVNGGSHDDNARCRCQTHLKPNTLLAECPLKRSRITSQQASEFAGEQRISTLLGNLPFPRPTLAQVGWQCT